MRPPLPWVITTRSIGGVMSCGGVVLNSGWLLHRVYPPIGGAGTGHAPSCPSRGHSLQARPRPLVHKCPLCINTDRKFWALGFVAMCQEATYASQQTAPLFNHLV